MKALQHLALLAGLGSMGADITSPVKSKSGGGYVKIPLTKKQLKNRAANKRSRKARRRSRKLQS
jgi:hypothetical protein